MKSYFLAVLLLMCVFVNAQVGINTTSPNATLDINASNSTSPGITDGILVPRMDEFSTSNPGSDQDGMLIFITGNGSPVKGFYYWDNSSSNWMPLNKKKHYVGELYGGGIVYYVYDDGQHGLIASLDDLNGGAAVSWGLANIDVPNCESYTDGATNTASIIAAGVLANEAAGLCSTYSSGGFTDWYLPSLIELRQIALALLTVNSVLENDGDPTTKPIEVGANVPNSGFYWSSTEQSNSNARTHSFSHFNSSGHVKWTVNARVRAIRAF